MRDGTIFTSLIMAKNKVAPSKQIDITRIELNACLLGARLKSTLTRELELEFEKVFMITDSEIVKAMISKDSYGFNTYVAVRIGEIQSKSISSQWYWVEGKLNIADWLTRGKKVHEIGPGSLW